MSYLTVEALSWFLLKKKTFPEIKVFLTEISESFHENVRCFLIFKI